VPDDGDDDISGLKFECVGVDVNSVVRGRVHPGEAGFDVGLWDVAEVALDRDDAELDSVVSGPAVRKRA